MTRNELIALVIEEGIDGASDLLGLSEDAIERAIYNDLDRREQAVFDREFASFQIDADEKTLDKLDEISSRVDRLEQFSGNNNWDHVRDLLVSNEITENDITAFEHLTANLTEAQLDRVLTFIDENEEGFSVLEMLYGADEEGYDFYSEDAAFWEWFRETFYSD